MLYKFGGHIQLHFWYHCVIFWPLTRPKNAIPRWCTGGSDTWPVIERDCVGGLRLIIWDKVKVPLCHYRVMHRKRVTSELYDSYFRLMTIKHSISKIEWASNNYITQLSLTSQLICSRVGVRVPVEWSCGKESHTRPKGLGALMNWGPEKTLIKCSKESEHPAEWTPGLRLSIRRTRKTQRDGHKFGVKILLLYSVSSSLSQ